MGYDINKIYPPIRRKLWNPPKTPISAQDWLEIGRKAGWVYDYNNEFSGVGSYGAGFSHGPANIEQVDPMAVSGFFEIFAGRVVKDV